MAEGWDHWLLMTSLTSLDRYLSWGSSSTRRYHLSSSQCFYHWIDTSAGGLVVLEGIICPVVSVSITGSIHHVGNPGYCLRLAQNCDHDKTFNLTTLLIIFWQFSIKFMLQTYCFITMLIVGLLAFIYSLVDTQGLDGRRLRSLTVDHKPNITNAWSSSVTHLRCYGFSDRWNSQPLVSV
jgi:hypothetical protein